MTDIPDWAKDKAREYFLSHYWDKESAEQLVPSLAMLLMEVSEASATIQYHKREAMLAEVRRVVVEVLADRWPADVFTPPPKGQHGRTVDACSAAALRAVVPGLRDEILARLEKLQ